MAGIGGGLLTPISVPMYATGGVSTTAASRAAAARRFEVTSPSSGHISSTLSPPSSSAAAPTSSFSSTSGLTGGPSFNDRSIPTIGGDTLRTPSSLAGGTARDATRYALQLQEQEAQQQRFEYERQIKQSNDEIERWQKKYSDLKVLSSHLTLHCLFVLISLVSCCVVSTA
jgi:hypothetical protein